MFRTDRFAAALAVIGYSGMLLCGAGTPADAQQGKKKPAAPKPAAQKKPAAPKPAPQTKPQAAATGPIVLGTTQLPGDFGKFGQTYTLGKREPLNFTLVSARYSVERFSLGNNTWVPKADQKLLILRYTVHNPNPRDTGYYWADLRFTAVDAQDTNHDFIQAVARAGKYDAPLSITLKPAQKIECEAAILVSADGPTPKLIVERERGAPVVRYDLRGKVAPVPAPFADPAVADGATTRAEVPVVAGTYVPLSSFDVKLESTGSLNEPVLRRELKPGYRNYTATFTIKNATQSKKSYYWSHFNAELRDADGEKVPFTQSLLKASRLEAASGELAPGEEARIRFFFPLPENVEAKTLYLKDQYDTGGKGRILAFDLSTAPAGSVQGG